jgi:hypothetical protein
MRTASVLLAVIALATMVWCLCARRLAWHALGERPITLAVTLQTVAVLILIPPMSAWLGPPLHAVTGQWNVAGLIGHWLCIASDAAIAYHVAWRANWEEDLRRGFKTHVELPATLGAGLMFSLWWIGNGSNAPVRTFYLVPLDLNMRLYWATFCTILAWILCYAVHSMFKLRQDPRSRATVTIYIAASCSGIISLALRIVELTPSLNTGAGLVAASVFGCGAIGGFAVGAGFAWVRKTKWLSETSNDLQQIPTTKPVKIIYYPRFDMPAF